MIRLFLALPLNVYFLPELMSYCDRNKHKFLDLKWVQADQIHITLFFFGSVDSSVVPTITENIQPIIASYKPMSLGLDGIGCFPNPRNMRVLWTGITGDVDTLIQCQHRVELELQKLGFPREEREFRAHATLARARKKSKGVSIDLKAFPNLKAEARAIGYVILYQSHLTPEGPRYEPLQTYFFEQG